VTRPERAEPAEPRWAVHFHSLGCPKNLLDTEVMLGSLAVEGYAIARRLEDADCVVVNTCAFIESAREESIQAILDLADLRTSGRLRALVVAGCLPQRYGAELARELPEVDAFVGTGRFPEIAPILDEVRASRSRGVYVDAGRTHLYDHESPRVLAGPRHSAYVKIAEGCDRICAFCAIPGIRGRFQSRRLDSVVAEAEALAAGGAVELNLVAQDSTSWGKDLPGRPRLADLVRALDAASGPRWIRLLYLYPTAVSDDLLEALAGAKRVLPYADVPLQHASDRLLRLMRRGTTAARQRALVRRLRERVPGVTLRTTFIVGFPGETDADFEELCEFVRESRFDRLGVFRYSDEEGTAACELPGKVPREVARRRHRRLVALQRELAAERMAERVGDEAEVLVDDAAPGRAHGRLASQAPEVDGVVFLPGELSASPRCAPASRACEPPPEVRTGRFYRIRLTGVRGADYEAEVLGPA